MGKTRKFVTFVRNPNTGDIAFAIVQADKFEDVQDAANSLETAGLTVIFLDDASFEIH